LKEYVVTLGATPCVLQHMKAYRRVIVMRRVVVITGKKIFLSLKKKTCNTIATYKKLFFIFEVRSVNSRLDGIT